MSLGFLKGLGPKNPIRKVGEERLLPDLQIDIRFHAGLHRSFLRPIAEIVSRRANDDGKIGSTPVRRHQGGCRHLFDDAVKASIANKIIGAEFYPRLLSDLDIADVLILYPGLDDEAVRRRHKVHQGLIFSNRLADAGDMQILNDAGDRCGNPQGFSPGF